MKFVSSNIQYGRGKDERYDLVVRPHQKIYL